MYITASMLATKNGCSVATISRIIKEMESSGRYPTAVRRCGKTTIDAEAFEDYVRHRKRRKRGEQ